MIHTPFATYFTLGEIIISHQKPLRELIFPIFFPEKMGINFGGFSWNLLVQKGDHFSRFEAHFADLSKSLENRDN